MRFRLYPTTAQAVTMKGHCRDARKVWNVALEQWNCWRPGRAPSPSYPEQAAQLTEARHAFGWLAEGSVTVQQQALRDFDQAKKKFYGGTHGRPTWRKAGIHEGFRQVGVEPGHVQRLNRQWGQVFVPKVGWVRFRWSRPVPSAKSYRVTLDSCGRWHIAFAVVPEPVDGPGDGTVVGIDRGVKVTLAMSDGTCLQAPTPKPIKRVARKVSRAKRGSVRRQKAKARLARAHAHNAAARKDFAEKASTTIARRYDTIRIEDLRVRNMVRSARGTIESPGKNVRQKSGLNRSIQQQAWGLFATRLSQKAAGRVEKVPPAFTSQRCSGCGHIASESRESQALFVCVACGYTDNADVNAAKNIAAGHAVTARRGLGVVDLPVKREPQLRLIS